MADIHSIILDKYDIDIKEVNLLKLYKIDDVSISTEDLEKKIADCRKKLNQSVNGANERFAERDRVHLEKAEKYEAILRNKKFRKELFAYYNKGSSSGSDLSFAKEYFAVVATTKKIKRKDVDFFFEYFQEERKNKKAILEMLSKEMKIRGLGGEKGYTGEDGDVEGKKKEESSPLIVNLFQEATLIKVHKCEAFFQSAAANEKLCTKYPALKEKLYDLLEMAEHTEREELIRRVAQKREEVFNLRQDKGQEYAPLLDLFNTISDILEYQDVVDNFAEFRMLLKYPKLTPYMYRFDEVKQNTIKSFFEIACRDYTFIDINDFILNYFMPIHDNFNIHSQALKKIVLKAEKRTKSNRILNMIKEKLGRSNKIRMPIVAGVLYCLVYWPVFLLYFVFEIFKIICTHIKIMTIPIFLVLLVLLNLVFPVFMDIDNLLVLGKIVNRAEWYSFIYEFTNINIDSALSAIFMSLYTILAHLMIYVIPSFFVSYFIYCIIDNLEETTDWKGNERTFQEVFRKLRNKTKEQYRHDKKSFITNKASYAVVNILCAIALGLMLYWIPKGITYVSEKTGYFQKEEPSIMVENTSDIKGNMPSESVAETGATVVEDEAQEELTKFVITVSKANIREGAGTEYAIITTAKEGTAFWGTGNQQEVESGSIWYEIYLNEELTEVGWASQAVIELANDELEED